MGKINMKLFMAFYRTITNYKKKIRIGKHCYVFIHGFYIYYIYKSNENSRIIIDGEDI